MTIETKFNIGDKVFFKKNNNIEISEVKEINVYVKDSVVKIAYGIDGYFIKLFLEDNLFKSEKELEEHYKNLK